MTREEHLQILASQAKGKNSNVIAADEVARWPEGRLDKLSEMGVLIPTVNASKVKCPGCGEDCSVDPNVHTLADGQVYVQVLCRKEGMLVEIDPGRLRQWEIVPEKLIELGYLEEEEADGMKQVWLDDAPEYLPNSEAIKLSEGKLSLSRLSKLLNPNGAIRYMRRGQRCKVHIADFRDCIKGLGDDMFTEKAFEGYFSGAEATKEAIRQTKEKTGK